MTYQPVQPLAWYGGSYYDYDVEPVATPVPADREDEAETRPDWKWEQRWKRGLVMGRFMPPHRGHEFLINFARAQVDKLSIGLRASPQDPISPTLRAGWLKALFPGCKVITDDHFFKVDVLFSSDARHQEFAEKIGAQLILCDPDRVTVPISATQIRSDPFGHWDFMAPLVRRHYLKVVRVVGAEGSGKTTLCQRLANHFRTCFVPEFAAALAARNGGKLPKSELASWARQHLAARQALELQANRLLFLDTDLASVAMWGDRMFGTSPTWIGKKSVDYAATLILDPVTDGLSAQQVEERTEFHKLWKDVPGDRLSGSAEERFAQALQVIRQRFGWAAE